MKILNGNGNWKWSHKLFIISRDGSITDYATRNVLGIVNYASSGNILVELQVCQEYRSFYVPTLHFMVRFYFTYSVKCDQKEEYGTMKSSIVRTSPQ